MTKIIQTLFKVISTRLGFVLALLFFYWMKTLWAYHIDFVLNTENAYQVFLTLINPIAVGLLLLGLALYVKKTRLFYSLAWLIYLLLTLLVIANAFYFREFSDFITVSTLLGSRKAAAGLGDSALNLIRITDLFYILDIVLLSYLFLKKKVHKDDRPFHKRASFAVTALSALFFSINLFLAEIDRPELLSRGFSNFYIVRALGLPVFSAYSGNQAYQAEKERSGATAEELVDVQSYVKEHRAAPNPEFFGMAKGRNVIVIHLESFQQFLIDYKLTVDGQEHEVAPFINSLYHSKETFSFSNVFHQVKAGKTSDAETLMENSLFGLNSGSFMVNYGGDNTQFAAPNILKQSGDYTSAVFHGNVGTFWNRNNAYKQWGYDYFFDESYFQKLTKKNSFQYGLNDKHMFSDSIQYFERLQQPFYTKFLTVSHHYPYTSLAGEKEEQGFPLAQTEDETINGYFATANYLDTSIQAFFNYLKAVGVYDKSIFVLYGDHYGISNSRNTHLAPLLGKDPETWTEYDNAMLQRVPYMIHIPGMDKGFISDTFGGQVDHLPTLLSLLGIDTTNRVQLGQDLLSSDNKQIVAFRNSGTYITPSYTYYDGKLYYTASGDLITNPDESTLAENQAIRDAVSLQLKMSDAVQTGDLLRFDKNQDLKPIDASNISYLDSLKALKAIEKKRADKSTSIYNQRGNQSSQNLFDAPSYMQLNQESTEITQPSSEAQ